MSTMLKDGGEYWIVSTVSNPHGSRRLSRGAVRVGKSDPKAVKTEMVKQAQALRVLLRVPTRKGAPVV